MLALIVLSCIGCDQATKALATAKLKGEKPLTLLWDGLELRYAENSGGFLSLGARLPAPARFFTFVIAVAVALFGIVTLAIRDTSLALSKFFAMAVIIGGGFSNLIDRLALGHVRDFAVLGRGPLRTGVFNLADVAVTLGCATLLFRWRRDRGSQEVSG